MTGEVPMSSSPVIICGVGTSCCIRDSNYYI